MSWLAEMPYSLSAGVRFVLTPSTSWTAACGIAASYRSGVATVAGAIDDQAEAAKRF